MKITFKLVLAIFMLSLFACSSDDSNNDNSDVALEGVWVLSALSVESSFDFNGDGEASRNLFIETPCYDNDFINFRSDGTVNIVTALTSITIEFTSSTDYGHVYECLSGLNQESSWSRDGNTVTVENGAVDLVGTISGQTLTVIAPDLFQIEMYDGTEFSYPEEDVVLVYTKQ